MWARILLAEGIDNGMIQTTLFPQTFRQLFALSNDDIANVFEQVADLLDAQGNDYYRIRAYRKGAEAIRQQNQPVVDLFEAKGTAGLEAIPYIGRRLARAIEELAHTGDLSLLVRLSIDVSPEDLFTRVPGIGQVLARRLYRGLGIHTLDELAQASQDDTLRQVPGFGHERIEQVRSAVETMLAEMPLQAKKRPDLTQSAPQKPVQRRPAQSAERPSPVAPLGRQGDSPNRWSAAPALGHDAVESPSLDLLLEVDRQYRYLARAGQLRMITPRRFNPEGRQWLPVMTLKKGGWSFNVLFSNTARAHELGKTDDWVVIHYAYEDEQKKGQGKGQSTGQGKGQCTVVTETRGVRRGQRVVRGLAIAQAS
ncbi:MAG: helix-hairpin-helix domain-containing protein [Cyanobacteria bacterium J06635_11]